jgi:DNA-binding MarR family transcriptional regulator
MSTYDVLEAYTSLRRELNLVLAHELKNAEFGQKQMMILFKLRKEPASMGEIAEYSLSDKAAVTRAVASLEKAGLVRRAASPEDQRKSIVELTAKGRSKAHEAERVRSVISKCINDTISVKERGQLAMLLQKVVAQLQVNSKRRN